MTEHWAEAEPKLPFRVQLVELNLPLLPGGTLQLMPLQLIVHVTFPVGTTQTPDTHGPWEVTRAVQIVAAACETGFG